MLATLKATRQLGLRVKLAAGIEVPDLGPIAGAAKLRGCTSQVHRQVLHIPQEYALTVPVVRRIGRLRKINDDRPIGCHQDVVLTEITVDQASAEHPHHFTNQEFMKLDGFMAHEPQIIESRCRLSLCVHDQFHEQDILAVMVWNRYTHPGSMQSIQRLHFGILPLCLKKRLSVPAALLHGPTLSGISNLAPFRIGRSLAEASILSLLIDFRHTQFASGTNQKYRRFLPAHQRTDDLIDETIIEER